MTGREDAACNSFCETKTRASEYIYHGNCIIVNLVAALPLIGRALRVSLGAFFQGRRSERDEIQDMRHIPEKCIYCVALREKDLSFSRMCYALLASGHTCSRDTAECASSVFLFYLGDRITGFFSPPLLRYRENLA